MLDEILKQTLEAAKIFGAPLVIMCWMMYKNYQEKAQMAIRLKEQEEARAKAQEAHIDSVEKIVGTNTKAMERCATAMESHIQADNAGQLIQERLCEVLEKQTAIFQRQEDRLLKQAEAQQDYEDGKQRKRASA